MSAFALVPAGDPVTRLVGGEGANLSDDELLSVILGSDVSVAREVAATWGSMPRLMSGSAVEFTALHALGVSARARLLAAIELGRRGAVWRAQERGALNDPESVVALCAPRMRGLDREHFWALALDTKNGLIKVVQVSIGSLAVSIVHPRELFKDAIAVSASSVILVHNHPSGDPTPSTSDVQLTRRLAEAGRLLGIEVLDHVVIGDARTWVSFVADGLM